MSENNEMIRKTVLKRIEELFKGLDATTLYVEKNEENPMDVLTTVHQEQWTDGVNMFGEYCFLPAENVPKGVQYFSSLITICETIQPGAETELLKACAAVNNVTACGFLAVDLDSRFVTIRTCIPLPETFSENQLYAECNLILGGFMNSAMRYCGWIKRVALGEASCDEALSIIL